MSDELNTPLQEPTYKYGPLLIDILEKASLYALDFGIAIQWNELSNNEEAFVEMYEFDGNEIEIALNVKYMLESVNEETIENASMMTNASVYMVIAKTISLFYPKCKSIAKLVKKKKEIELFGLSFCTQYSGVKPEYSLLRSELDTMNFYRKYKESGNTIAEA